MFGSSNSNRHARNFTNNTVGRYGWERGGGDKITYGYEKFLIYGRGKIRKMGNIV